jgi:hypothetical protein
MKKYLGILSLAMFFMCLTVLNAAALTWEFTATSAQSGVLGYLQYDSTVFDGTGFQYVDNSNLLAINFTDPLNTSLHVVTPGPSGQGTFFDSTGALPTVVGGSGFTGGTDSTLGVWIFGTNGVLIGHDIFNPAVSNDVFSDVTWSTREVSSAVPEPSTFILLGFSLAGIGLLRRRMKN